MRAIVNYKNTSYKVFEIYKRNKEGGFSGGLCLNHTNSSVKDWHFTYPSNGAYHYTIKTSDGKKISFYGDKIIIKENGSSNKFLHNNRSSKIKELAHQNLVPFGSGGRKPSIYEVINGSNFLITNFFINYEALFLFPKLEEEPNASDLVFNTSKYLKREIMMEAFMSMDGKSNLVVDEVVVEKKLDDFLPIVKLRFVIQKS